jgi:hypothetical protein
MTNLMRVWRKVRATVFALQVPLVDHFILVIPAISFIQRYNLQRHYTYRERVDTDLVLLKATKLVFQAQKGMPN